MRRRGTFYQQIQSFSYAEGIDLLYNSAPVVKKIVSSPAKSRRADLMLSALPIIKSKLKRKIRA